MIKKVFYVFTALTALFALFVFGAWAEEDKEAQNDNETVLSDVEDAEEDDFNAAEDQATCVKRGDVDFDGSVTTSDARLILRFAVSLQDPDDSERVYSDLDDNGNVSSADARKALRIAVSLERGPGHITEEELVLVQATCYSDGKTADKCALCGKNFNFGVIPQRAHTGSGWDTVVVSTCTTTGIKEMRCVYCNKLMQTDEAPLKPHIYGEIKYKDEKDCTKMREVYRECVNCGNIYSFILNPGTHTYDWTVTTEPTCTEMGREDLICVVCGTAKPDTLFQLLSPLGHDFPEYWTVLVFPTATEEGLRVKNCSRCEEQITEVIPKTGGDIVVEGE